MKEKSYHFADSILVDQCHQIKSFLAKKGFNSKIIPYIPGLYLKDAAAIAGIGPIGKNNLLITKTFGSQVRLRALVTVAELSYGTPIHESDYCKNCSMCVDSCPVSALEGGTYNKELCNNYCLNNLKDLSENTVIWCNICIEACPIGKK
jgi:epoxyqueuosine reductase QueG